MSYAKLIYDSIESFPQDLANLVGSYLTYPVQKCVAEYDIKFDYVDPDIFDNIIAFGSKNVFISAKGQIIKKVFELPSDIWQGPCAQINNNYIFTPACWNEMFMLGFHNGDEIKNSINITNHINNTAGDRQACSSNPCSKIICINDIIIIAIHGTLFMHKNGETRKIGEVDIKYHRVSGDDNDDDDDIDNDDNIDYNEDGGNGHPHINDCRDKLLITWDKRILWFSHGALLISLSPLQDLWNNTYTRNNTRFQPTGENSRFIEIFLDTDSLFNITQFTTSEILCVSMNRFYIIDITKCVLLRRERCIHDAIMLTSDNILIMKNHGILTIENNNTIKHGPDYLVYHSRKYGSLYKTKDGSIFGFNGSDSIPLILNQPDIINNLHCKLNGYIIGELKDGTLISERNGIVYFYQ